MEWNTATLLAPRTGGRSRFSKALPMPPSPPHETTPESILAAASSTPKTPTTATSPAFQIPRKLPGLPNMATTMALPPRKDSVGARFIPKPINSPLPALPALPANVSSPLELQKKMPPIPRKAVASPPLAGTAFTSPPPPDTQLEPEAVDPVKLKRKSSISSLLSAYSNTSSDSIHMYSSHRSSDTKGSEASLSPDRGDGQRDGQQRDFSSAYTALSRNPYEEPSAREKEIMMHEPLPPPPPMKEANASPRPAAQRNGLPATPRGDRPAPAPPAAAAVPATTMQKDGDAFSSSSRKTPSPPPRREIWRRRASSKSDRSIAVSGLKLAVSHGSTAATTMAASQPALAEGLSQQKSASHPAILNPTLAANGEKSSQIPPQPNSGLPGRNIRPQAQPQPQQSTVNNNENGSFDNEDEMKRLRELKMQALGQRTSQESDKSTLQPQAIDSPTLKPSPAGSPTAQGAIGSARTAPDAQPPLSPPSKSLKRRDIGRKPSLQNMNKGNEVGAAQHLREARSAIDLRAARDKQQADAAAAATMENFPALEPPHFPGQYYGGAPSPRSPRTRGLSSASNASGRRVPNPQLMVTSPAAPPVPRPRVEYKDMEYVEMTPQEQNDLSAAITRAFGNRSREWAKVAAATTPNKDGVWPCRELSADHLTCPSDHRGWISTPNVHYPIACMLCHDGSKESRRVCRSCGIRVCPGCSELLTGVKIENLDFNALASKEKEKEDAIVGEQ